MKLYIFSTLLLCSTISLFSSQNLGNLPSAEELEEDGITAFIGDDHIRNESLKKYINNTGTVFPERYSFNVKLQSQVNNLRHEHPQTSLITISISDTTKDSEFNLESIQETNQSINKAQTVQSLLSNRYFTRSQSHPNNSNSSK